MECGHGEGVMCGPLLICIFCHEQIPLGAANNGGEHAEAVAIEMRAAAIAADFDEDEWLGGFVGLGTLSPNGEHGPLIADDIAAGNRDKWPRDLNDYLAGHLARCIHDHTEQP